MKQILAALVVVAVTAQAQETIPQPAGTFYGVVLTDEYRQGALYAPQGMQLDLTRTELALSGPGQFMRESVITTCEAAACYGLISYGMNKGAGLLNGDYIRVHGDEGSGPTIAHKVGVRGSSSQWAVWAEQINLGPGAKAAFWIGGDNPNLDGLAAHAAPNVMVIAGDLDVTGAVIQWNQSAGSTGDLMRVFRAGRQVFRVTADGTVLAKGFGVLP